MGFELIANGLNFTLNALSVASNLTSIVSYLSGFSLEKNIDQIAKSVQSLNDISKRIDDLSKTSYQSNILLNEIATKIPTFRGNDIYNQGLALQHLSQLWEQEQLQRKHERDLLYDTINEMKNILQSFRYAQSQPQEIPRKMLNTLTVSPEKVLHYIAPFNSTDIMNQSITQRIMNQNISPVILQYPNNQSYFGAISNQYLYDHGVKLHVPQYTASIDGHIFSPKHGLYLPSILF